MLAKGKGAKSQLKGADLTCLLVSIKTEISGGYAFGFSARVANLSETDRGRQSRFRTSRLTKREEKEERRKRIRHILIVRDENRRSYTPKRQEF